MRYLTHHFAHPETLDRALRWLVNAGVSPDRVTVHHDGVPRLAIATDPTEMDGIEMVIRAAEMNDPDGLPGLWDLARLEPAETRTTTIIAAPPPLDPGRAHFALAWHPVDHVWNDDLRRLVEREKDYREVRP